MPITALPDYVMIDMEGYSEKADFGVQRSPMDGGIPKQRARWSLPIVTRSMTLLIDGAANREAFDTWHRETLRGGVDWFTLSLFGKTSRARFTEPLSFRPSGPEAWTATAAVETVG